MENICYDKDLFEENYFANLTERMGQILLKNSMVKHLEIYASSTKSTKISFEEGFIKNAYQKTSGGIGLRVIGSEGKEGMTFTSDLSGNALTLIMDEAIKMMNASTPNPEFIDLAKPSKYYKQVDGTYDPEIVHLCPDDINGLIKPIFLLKKKELKPHALSGGFSASVGNTYIWNSNGIAKWDQFSTAGCSAEVSVSQNNNPSGGFDWQSVCQLKDLDVNNVAETSYQMAIRGLKKKSLKTGEYPIILSPLAVSNFLIEPLTDAINSEKVQNQMSFLGEKLNEQIGAEKLTILDDPHYYGRLGTESFDAEGTATKPTTIIKNGILREFYHNTFTAGKEGIESNGHASRANYSGRVGISNNNILIEPGTKSWQDMVSDIKKGIYFIYTGDSPNEITGDFSGLIMTGYIIEDGEIGPAVLETMLGINLLDAFANVENISKERKWIDEVYSPWIKISKATISGRD